MGKPFAVNTSRFDPYNSIQQHLAELEFQAKLRSQVYEDWGFERLYPLGKGLTVLFAGSSGTGKTMAAQVLARSLGRRSKVDRTDRQNSTRNATVTTLTAKRSLVLVKVPRDRSTQNSFKNERE